MSARNHYVYELLCEDGPYIGHSCREDRAAQHKYAGRKVLSFRKLQDGLTKQEALTLERQTIAEAGRVDLGTGPLTNLRIRYWRNAKASTGLVSYPSRPRSQEGIDEGRAGGSAFAIGYGADSLGWLAEG